MNAKLFSQRFNREIACFGLPDDLAEKTKGIARVFGMSRHMAHSLLFGYNMPDDEWLDKIASTLEICPMWLSGRTNKRKAYSPLPVAVEE